MQEVSPRRTILYDSAHVRCLDWPHSQRQKRGEGNREPVFTGCRVSVLQDEKFWSWMVVKVTQNVDVLYADEMCP